jgi:hypothetical protein
MRANEGFQPFRGIGRVQGKLSTRAGFQARLANETVHNGALPEFTMACEAPGQTSRITAPSRSDVRVSASVPGPLVEGQRPTVFRQDHDHFASFRVVVVVANFSWEDRGDMGVFNTAQVSKPGISRLETHSADVSGIYKLCDDAPRS